MNAGRMRDCVPAPSRGVVLLLGRLGIWGVLIGAPCARAQDAAVTVNTATSFQTIEGFGGAIAFYNGWVTAHPYKEEIYEQAFGGLNRSMLRLANWFRYQGTANFDPEAAEFTAAASRILGRPVPILMSSWSPPAFLKSNGEVGHGGTLASIGANWAGYPNALAATFQRLADLPSPPKLLGPETVGIGYNVTQNYAATMDPDHFYGLAYHLYHGSSDGTPDGYNTAFRAAASLFRGKPKFMEQWQVTLPVPPGAGSTFDRIVK
jgi:glucuronoarabinoxylan endo-1,4-beta-xylanase